MSVTKLMTIGAIVVAVSAGAAWVRAQPAVPVVGVKAIDEAARTLDALAASGADRAVLVGLAGADEQDRTDAAARRVIQVIGAAGAANSDGRELVLGRAHLLLAARAVGVDERKREAALAITMLADHRLATTAAEALRRVSLAGALGLGDPQKYGDIESPSELLESVLEFPVGSDPLRNVPKVIHAEALALRVHVGAATAREKALIDLRAAISGGALAAPRGSGKAEEVFDGFAEEVEARAGLNAQGGRLSAEAVGTLLSPVAQRSARAEEVGDEATARLLRERVRATIERTGAASGTLPEAVSLAWVRGELARAPAAEKALKKLRELASGKGSLAADALWALARYKQNLEKDGNHGDHDASEAGALFAQFAQRFPGDRRAAEALRAAELSAETALDEPLARELLRQRAGTPDEARAAERLARAIMSVHGETRHTRLGEVLELLDRARGLTPNENERLIAVGAEATTGFVVWVEGAKVAMGAPAATSAAAAARAGETWARRNQPARGGELAVLAGDLLARVPGHAEEALDAYRRAVADPVEKTRAGAIAGLGLLWRASLKTGASGKAPAPTTLPESVFEVLKSLTDSEDAAARGTKAAPAAARPDAYWHAWSEMLAIMAARNAGGERSGQIRLRIRQLLTIDPALGGGEWAKRIRAIEGELGG